jgi:uncharacterized membrane protein YfcA
MHFAGVMLSLVAVLLVLLLWRPDMAAMPVLVWLVFMTAFEWWAYRRRK